MMKVNSQTFLCALPHFRPPPSEESDTPSLTHAEEEKERLRAVKRDGNSFVLSKGIACTLYSPASV